MPELIKPEHREAIKQVADTGPTAAVRRRAALLLHYDAGHATVVVAEYVGFSTSSVLRWRRLYREQGLGIFPTVNHPAPAVSEAEAIKDKPKAEKKGGKGKTKRKQVKKTKAKKAKTKKAKARLAKKLVKAVLAKKLVKKLKKGKGRKQKRDKAKKTGKKKK